MREIKFLYEDYGFRESRTFKTCILKMNMENFREFVRRSLSHYIFIYVGKHKDKENILRPTLPVYYEHFEIFKIENARRYGLEIRLFNNNLSKCLDSDTSDIYTKLHYIIDDYLRDTASKFLRDNNFADVYDIAFNNGYVEITVLYEHVNRFD